MVKIGSGDAFRSFVVIFLGKDRRIPDDKCEAENPLVGGVRNSRALADIEFDVSFHL
jgi:hypothetical protein